MKTPLLGFCLICLYNYFFEGRGQFAKRLLRFFRGFSFAFMIQQILELTVKAIMILTMKY
jgi:hypothetical protein